MEDKILYKFKEILNETLDKKFKEQDDQWTKKINDKFEQYHAQNVREVSNELYKLAENAGKVDKNLEDKINLLEEKMNEKFEILEKNQEEMKKDLKKMQKMIMARFEFDEERIEKLEEKVG